ncbi:dephospho-CoA kinase [Actinoplanes derwentensis]|uniref:Uridine kinase n=1 Tax=Actinoplanes derwentensis TaxID=113562 RepID=A0A1H2BPD2_9ACTN|nr:dephospho-CoA kinase [Actinoplanes derwentensis]GID86914.1 adenylate kinase [Actinoplanes derwentensis]SDT59917.1 Uridine kinase [Actinoplanes derwentensis]
MSGELEAAAERVVAWAGGLEARAGSRRVLAVEGRSGSGKTTLAAAVAERLVSPLIHMDDLYAGWDGLDQAVIELHDRVLVPLADGRPAVWRRWDWAAGEYRGEHRVPDAGWLVVEGVGAGGRVLRSYTSGLVWLDSPTVIRKRRALDRDGQTYAPHWARWARHEDAFYAAEQVRENADLIIENAGE